MAEELEIPTESENGNDPLGILSPKKQSTQLKQVDADPLGILKKKVGGNVLSGGTMTNSQSKLVSDFYSLSKRLESNPEWNKPKVEQQIPEQPKFNPQEDKAVKIDANVAMPTNLPKGEQIAYAEKEKTNEAITNALKARYANKGLTYDEKSPQVKKDYNDLAEMIKNGDAAVVVGTKDGKPNITRGENWTETLTKTIINSLSAPIKAYDVNKISNPNELADYFDAELAQQPNIPESAPSGVSGGIAEMVGGTVKPVGLLSLNAAVPNLGTAAMASESYYTALANQKKQLYQRGLNEGLSREEAAKKAMDAAVMAAVPDAAMALILSGEFGGLTGGAKAVLNQSADVQFGKALSKAAKSVTKVAGAGGLSEGLRSASEAANGYNVTVPEAIEKMWDGASEYGKMDLGFKIAGGLIAAPKYLVSAAKEYLSNVPKEMIDAHLSEMGEDGQKINQSLQSYQQARQKVNGIVPDKYISNYAGLIEKQDKIKQTINDLEMRKLLVPEAIRPKINEQISEQQNQVNAIDAQLKKMSKSKDPSKEEVDDVTGEKVGDEQEYKPITVIKPEENIPVETTTIAPKEYTPETKKSGVSIILPKQEEKVTQGTVSEANIKEPLKINGTNVIEHGEDTNTSKGLENGTKATDLTDKGVEEAKNLGDKIKEDGKTGILTSPVERATQTAKEAAKQAGIPEENIKTNDLLKTWNIGEYDGKQEGSFVEKEWADKPNEKPKGGESFNDFTTRMEDAYKLVKEAPKDVQVVSHSKVMRALEALKETDGKWTPETTKEFLRLGEEESQAKPLQIEQESQPIAEQPQQEIEPILEPQKRYEEINNLKSEKVKSKEKAKFVEDHFDSIVSQLMLKNKIKRICP